MHMNYTNEIRQELPPSCVVGIGASAGGLEALQQFLTFLPGNTGMSFVIIQHLAPDHKSLLTDILGKYTSMPVIEARDGMQVRRNHIYMIPPRYNLEITSDVLHLTEYNHTKINHPIDIFFRSLAHAYENRAVAIILSGTGSDGTNGIRSIKEQNGVIIVQSPESAKFDGMPRNAIATGFVDIIKAPDSIAREMAHISASLVDATSQLQLTDEDLLSQVFSILKDITNTNYTYYKQTTILRRIERRLVVTHTRNLREYVTYLKNNPDEARVLAKEVLIGVTSFFRDADYFEVLKEKVIRTLVMNATPQEQIRVWVAGCSTGEEAYSIAILFMEILEEIGERRDIKIFATDLDSDAIAVASKGVYGDNIIEDVSVQRLSRYFARKGNTYVVRHDLRKMIVFAQHNVFQDPPFGKLDLISCRNLLIYFQTVLQRNLFAIFHIALNDRGYLFLGRSESVINYDDVFRTLCANEKIFVHNLEGKAPPHERISYTMQSLDHTVIPINMPRQDPTSDVQYNASELDLSTLEAMMPACVLVDERNDLVRTYGDCSKILNVPPGAVTLDIFAMIRTDLKIAVSTALRECREMQDRVAYDKIPVLIDEEVEYISIVAQPIYDNQATRTGYIAIAFLRGHREVEKDMKEYRIDTQAAQRIASLERELKVSQDNLRRTVTELESVNAELQAANEELLTANEELQSSNEELQSVNEELYTVNSEYQSKVSELARVNDDMANFLSSTMVGVLMVDQNLNIRKFTEYISTEFNVADQDVGRSLRYISFNFATIDLLSLCRDVLSTMHPSEHLAASISGQTYLIRIAPFKTYEHDEYDDSARGHRKLHGLVLTFIDTAIQIDDKQQIEEMARALRAAVKSGREKETFLSHISHDMRTPMAAILGLTNLTLEEPDLSPVVRDNLEKIDSAGRYLTNLIGEILETSRLNAGKVVSICQTVKEDALLDEIHTIIESRTKDFGQKFEYYVHGNKSRYVLMDTEHVERILMNLLSNAVKFTPKGGTIRLSCDITYGDNLVTHTYTIADTGIGMSDDFQSRMFLPFEQEQTDAGLREGTGLGLYICKNLVDLLGGSISCRSKVGEGTEFRIILTYALATGEQIALLNSNAHTYEDNLFKGKNVLLAEDTKINAEVIIRLLEKKGIHVDLAHDGQEAVNLFNAYGAYHYQAVLMDLMMPVKNGLAASTEIRTSDSEDAKTIPIIALTADVQSETESKCFDAGMTTCLSKPIDPKRLFTTLAQQFVKAEKTI